MAHRTKTQWLTLLDEQDNSGKTIVDFCSKRGISHRYFRVVKSKLKKERIQRSQFVAIDTRSSTSHPLSSVSIRYQQVQLEVAISADPTWIANLIKGLAS